MMRPTPYIILMIAVAVGCMTASAQRQRTTRTGRLQPIEQTNATINDDAIARDTITHGLDRVIHLSGYDKPITASRETLHAENLTDTLVITSVECEITYLDNQGRQLHKRTVTLRDEIKPGQTEMLSFPTWDIQHSFYYRLSVKPRRQATPYDVQFNILSITCHKKSQQ